VSYDVLTLVLRASLIVQLVLLLLLVFSVVSWAVIVAKWRELRNAEQDSEAFLEVYHREPFEAAFEAGRQLDRSPLAIVFPTCCNEMSRFTRGGAGPASRRLEATQLRALSKSISWSAMREVHRLERGLAFLATVGSSAPFIGLFGTVVGIIGTFHSIGQAGNASLAVVGPGMAEALVATAFGLLAAIPASVFYNHFVARIESIQESIGIYAGELEEDLGRLGGHPQPAAVRASGE